MDHLTELEDRSIHILREAYASFKSLCMLWSIGKDSTVLLWLARRAFFGHVPFPLVHIDTSFKIPEMIAYRDRMAAEWNLNIVYGENREALDAKQTFPDGAVDRITCCWAPEDEGPQADPQRRRTPLPVQPRDGALRARHESRALHRRHRRGAFGRGREPFEGALLLAAQP